MALQNIQLCHIDPVDRSRDKFSVTVHSNDQKLLATFSCSSVGDATKLRDAIREHSDGLIAAVLYDL